jgi:coiled-coil domain-containing protein 12
MQNPFGNIAPKNPNWDLKRDVQKRIDKLEKRTQKALAEIACECSNMINWQIISLFSIVFAA